jgi:hypothetical protein
MEFLDSTQQWRPDSKGKISGKIMCVNLCNALLRMNNDMIAKILGSSDADSREALLDEYQIHKTQGHAHELGSDKFQLKLMKKIIDFIYNLSENEIIT